MLKSILAECCLIMTTMISFAQNGKVSTGKDFELTGDIGSAKQGFIVHTYISGGHNIIDTVKVVNGKFTFRGKVDGWSNSTLRSDSLRFLSFQYIQNARMHVSQKNAVSEVVFEGSAFEDESRAYKKKAEPLLNKYSELNWACKALFEKDSAAANKMKREQVDPAWNAYLGVVKDHIVKHPNSAVSLDQLRFVHRSLPVKELKWMFEKLGKEIRQSPQAASLRVEIASRSTEYVGKQAINFTQNDMSGKPVSLSSFKGKYVLLDFWASWCVPCRAENPSVLKAYNIYSSKGLEILAVSTDKDESQWRKAVNEDQLPWIQVRNIKGGKNDIASHYNIYKIPSNFLINPKGIIIAQDLRGHELQKKLAEIFPQK